MTELKISVITVNLNNADGLRKTLDSLVCQSFSPEIIVIDGQSSDHSVGVLKEFGPKLGSWISERDSGIYDAMNKIVAQWHQAYNFVGSYYINVGNNPPDQTTNWNDWK